MSDDHRPDNRPTLSPREQDCVALIARGYSSQRIASELHIQLSTVETTIRRACYKLNARNRAHLVHLWNTARTDHTERMRLFMGETDRIRSVLRNLLNNPKMGLREAISISLGAFSQCYTTTTSRTIDNGKASVVISCLEEWINGHYQPRQ
jgi:DNA-binding CsgD family transcriptional regulator